MKKLANNSQRFLAYFVDFIIINFVVSLITSLIFTIINFDTELKTVIYNKMLEEVIVAIETGYINDYINYCIEFLKYSFFEIGIQIACASVVFIGYLVVLPHFWDKQTVGRLVSKTKVQMLNGSKPTTKAIILREFVGSFLLYYCIGTIPLIISIVLTNKHQRSLVDKIANTNLIYNGETIEVVNPYQEDTNDYIDAKFVEVHDEKEEVSKKNDEPEADEDGYIIF